jgi:hypothetical protein
LEQAWLQAFSHSLPLGQVCPHSYALS